MRVKEADRDLRHAEHLRGHAKFTHHTSYVVSTCVGEKEEKNEGHARGKANNFFHLVFSFKVCLPLERQLAGIDKRLLHTNRV